MVKVIDSASYKGFRHKKIVYEFLRLAGPMTKPSPEDFEKNSIGDDLISEERKPFLP